MANTNTAGVQASKKISSPKWLLLDGSQKNSGRTPEKKERKKPLVPVVKTAPAREHQISAEEAEKNLKEYQKKMAARKAAKIKAVVENTTTAIAGRFNRAAAALAPRTAPGNRTNDPRLSQEAKGKGGGAPQKGTQKGKKKGKAKK